MEQKTIIVDLRAHVVLPPSSPPWCRGGPHDHARRDIMII